MKAPKPWSRRQWLGAATSATATATATLTAASLGLPALVRAADPSPTPTPRRSRLGMPGLHPGRVVVTTHPACLTDGRFRADPIRRMIDSGMMELTDADDPTQAWRQFFERGDVVGIKVTPVGAPHVISSPEVLHAIIAGLESAGVRRSDIIVFERYRKEFLDAGMDRWIPDGVRWSYASPVNDTIQQDMDRYDPAHFVDFATVLPGQDPSNPAARRSYVAQFVTRDINKLINLPTLKDHQSAGVTLCLKNLSHGLVNNVARTHVSSTHNVCGAFIPAVVSLPVIRDKTVLHILDGIRALCHGGPFARPEFVWEHRALYFSTDPVALDRVGWREIDRKRATMGLAPIAEAKPDRYSSFLNRQPEHVEIAGALGLGLWDEKRLDLRRRELKA